MGQRRKKQRINFVLVRSEKSLATLMTARERRAAEIRQFAHDFDGATETEKQWRTTSLRFQTLISLMRLRHSVYRKHCARCSSYVGSSLLHDIAVSVIARKFLDKTCVGCPGGALHPRPRELRFGTFRIHFAQHESAGTGKRSGGISNRARASWFRSFRCSAFVFQWTRSPAERNVLI